MQWSLLALAAMLAITPTSPEPASSPAVEQLNEAITLEARNNLAGAEAALRRALAADPSLVTTYYRLALVLRKLDRRGEARTLLEAGLRRATKGTEEHAQMSYALGSVLSSLVDDASDRDERTRLRRGAIEAFSMVVVGDSVFRAHHKRGQQLRALQEPKQADAAFRSCIAQQSSYMHCFVDLGQMYIDYGYIEQGFAVLDEGCRINPDDAVGWTAQGNALMVMQRYREAKENFEKAYGIDPDRLDVLYGLGLTSFELGERDKSVEYLQMFLQRAGNDVPGAIRAQAQSLLYRQQDAI